jgi:hypothetical protein
MDSKRVWDGRAVSAMERSEIALTDKLIRVDLTPKAARTLALALGRLKQTTITLPGDAQEVLTALDYVMVADPASVRKHAEMEAGKGMTPDGGYKAPTPNNMPPKEIRRGDGRTKF